MIILGVILQAVKPALKRGAPVVLAALVVALPALNGVRDLGEVASRQAVLDLGTDLRMTRGEGGQNETGSELYNALGATRTHEVGRPQPGEKSLMENESFLEVPPSMLPVARLDYDDGQDPTGVRLFRTTTTRTQISLDGFWYFVADPDDTGEKEGYATRFPEPETQLWVPGTWNATARYWEYQGPAWFQRTFDVPHNGHLRLRFGGVFYWSKVWLDGELLGEHEGGYLPFDFVVQNVEKGTHTLTVRVDSSLDDETLPKAMTGWFPYGGIYRPVYAELIPDVYIHRFHVIPSDITARQVKLEVRVFARSVTGGSAEKEVSFAVNGDTLYKSVHTISGEGAELVFDCTMKKPRLWSPDEPNLYSARVALGGQEDDQFDRFGVRSLEAKGHEILLNGKRLKIMGANRHDDHPDWGSAVPPHLVRADVEILKRMGANAVRMHYPASELFMDYCDQNGLVFMAEVPSWQYDPEQLAKASLKDKIKKQYRGMVCRDMNHPCVLSWSLGNEWREFEKSYDDVKELVEYARTVDTTHFVTFIVGGAHPDRSQELVDLACFNWVKHRWYDKEPTTLDNETSAGTIEAFNLIREKLPNKPVILSEFGASGSQAGWHNWGNVKWSEEYQARNVWDSGEYGLAQDWISGGCVWQFCDTRANPKRMLGQRLRGWNVKGVVDGYRQPKWSYYKLQELFRKYGKR